MIVNRNIAVELNRLANQYPVVTITGPRQSGKTTLAKLSFPDLPYFSLENPDTRQQIQLDPNGFLNANKNGVIIDEFQRYPDLLSFIQGEVDNRKKNRQFILTGSNQLSMLSNLSQSLAGRTALLKLLPFSISEITAIEPNLKVDHLLTKGFYPGIYSNNLDPYKAYSGYYETYIECGVRQLSNLQNLTQFQLFIRLCAGRIGQLFNASAIANEVGVSKNTIIHWLSLLQASYIVFMLQPWHANFKKRLVKTPKLYFYDVGLASYLLGIEKEEYIQTHPLRGSLYENMVLMELLKSRFNAGYDNNLFFYRDNHNNEVDVVQEHGHVVNLFEIKSSMTFHSDFLKGLNYLKKLIPDRINKSTLVYSGKDDFDVQNHRIVNYQRFLH